LVLVEVHHRHGAIVPARGVRPRRAASRRRTWRALGVRGGPR
jgi:hypothetical protein